MPRAFFVFLSKVNRLLLPKFYLRDLKRLKTWEKAMIGYKIWVAKNILP
jgi:hypothetical protein